MSDKPKTPSNFERARENASDFIISLRKLNPGGLAVLRRSAGKNMVDSTDAHSAFFRAIPKDLPRWSLEYYFLIATLYPHGTHKTGVGTLGRTLWRAREKRLATSKSIGTGLDKRFNTLIECDKEELAYRVRQAVKLAQGTNKTTIDFAELLVHLTYWNAQTKWVQLRWSEDYYYHLDGDSKKK